MVYAPIHYESLKSDIRGIAEGNTNDGIVGSRPKRNLMCCEFVETVLSCSD